MWRNSKLSKPVFAKVWLRNARIKRGNLNNISLWRKKTNKNKNKRVSGMKIHSLQLIQKIINLDVFLILAGTESERPKEKN